MPEMHLRQPGFTYSNCGPFTKNKEIIQKFKETGYIYLQKWARKSLLSIWYGLWKFWRFTKKNNR